MTTYSWVGSACTMYADPVPTPHSSGRGLRRTTVDHNLSCGSSPRKAPEPTISVRVTSAAPNNAAAAPGNPIPQPSSNTPFPRTSCRADQGRGGEGGGGCTRLKHDRGRTTTDPHIPTMLGRSTSDFLPTRETSVVAPSVKHREVFGESA